MRVGDARPQTTHRVATAAFWFTFHHEGKISSGWWGWWVGCTPTPFHYIYLKELPGYPVENSLSGSSLSWGGPVGRGGIVYDIVWMECPTPEGHPGQCCVHLYARILSTSFTSVSIFSVWCCSLPLYVLCGKESASVEGSRQLFLPWMRSSLVGEI